MGTDFRAKSCLTMRRTSRPSILGIFKSSSTSTGGSGSRPVNFPAQRGEPDAGALEFFFPVQPLEDAEQFVRVGHVEAYAVVPHHDNAIIGGERTVVHGVVRHYGTHRRGLDLDRGFGAEPCT